MPQPEMKDPRFAVDARVRVSAQCRTWPGERGVVTRVFSPPRSARNSVCYFVQMASDGLEVAFFEAELEADG